MPYALNMTAKPLRSLLALFMGCVLFTGTALAQGSGPSGSDGGRPWDLSQGGVDKGDASYGTTSAWTKINGVQESWGYVAGDRVTASSWSKPNGDTMECTKVGGQWTVTITRAAGGTSTYTLK
jgi:hypothetical protein